MEEALLAKQHAEMRFVEKDFVGARNYALKAQALFPELEGISQMVATFDIYVASEGRVNGEVDFYAVLGLKPSVGRSMIKKQYKRLAVLLHPDKNRTVGADGAFRLVSEAWTHLSDHARRASYDLKRNGQLSSAMVGGVIYREHCPKSAVPPTFWTVCTSCQVQYEYLRKYVNKRLSCKNCHGTFMAVELGTAPINGAYPVSQNQWSFAPDNGFGSHGYSNVTFVPTSTVVVSGNGIPTHHSGHGSEYVSNVSFEWGTNPGSTVGYANHNGYSSADTLHGSNGYRNKPGRKPKSDNNLSVDASVGCNQSSVTREKRPYKRRKVGVGGYVVNGNDLGAKIVTEAVVPSENGCSVPKFSITTEPSLRQPIPQPVDIRGMLIDKARTVIRKKLEEIKLASSENSQKANGEAFRFGDACRQANVGVLHWEPKKLAPVTLTVPDSDFHDFDKDRTEECFMPKQIWALYDEEDGMPRLYCLIRQILSVNPFKIFISYLGSKTDLEFGSVNWIDSGFTKSCGHFRATNTDIIEEVNIFSHLLSREKAGRGGCVRIFPRSGDIWAVYRNWSPDWNRSTPYDVRHQYEMVEVLNDYSEDYGVSVVPLLKVDGYKTVYRRNTDKDAVQWITRREMVRFSHQVPSRLLKEVSDLPEGCWDLDPAAIPDNLLQPVKDVDTEEKPHNAET